MSDPITPTRLRELCKLSDGDWGPPHPDPGQCHATRCRAADTIEALQSDLKANAAMLARQTDLAREAEIRASRAERLGEDPGVIERNGDG